MFATTYDYAPAMHYGVDIGTFCAPGAAGYGATAEDALAAMGWEACPAWDSFWKTADRLYAYNDPDVNNAIVPAGWTAGHLIERWGLFGRAIALHPIPGTELQIAFYA